jgi:hypothetical protein
MRRRLFLLLISLLPASALGQLAAPAEDGPARFGLKPHGSAFGLRADPPPSQVLPQPALRFAPAPGNVREGWSAFGSMGPMRWARPLREDADMAWRFGGRPQGMPSSAEMGGMPKRLNVGIQYRF